ncbi:MAG: ATP-dependent zinc metalloprotease FtsH [bacterium]|nr:ATP-dependent zinc metalloprotease FtsH [bacterium]
MKESQKKPAIDNEAAANGNGKRKTNGQKHGRKIFELKLNLSPRDLVFYLLIGLLVVSSLISLSRPMETQKEVPLSQALSDIKNGNIKEVALEGDKMTLVYNDGKTAASYKEQNESLIKILETAGIDPKTAGIKIKDQSGSQAWISFLSNILPIALMAVFFLFLMKQAKGAQDNLFSFGASKAKLFTKDLPKTTFNDVAGVDEAKQELAEIVDFLRHPEKYEAVGARTPKGVLLVGPSGTGKTLLARALAGEAQVPFFSMAGSEFMEMLVGVGASRVRDLFSNAKKAAPSIIFIDEIESIGRARSMFGMTSHDEREQTLNQILVEMDGFSANERVLVAAATNRPDLLDPALTRPGRFDRKIMLELPDIEGRKAILAIHGRGKPFGPDVSWEKIAKRTVGFSGADLENMLNEAAILAAREARKTIEPKDLEEAATKVKLGPEKKRLQSDEDKKMTAYHEAGHAVIVFSLPHMDPVHRISIVSRGMALGFTLIPPERDRIHETQSHLLEQITSMLGGRAAEEIVFKEFTSGAASDIDHATGIARSMVLEFGMSGLGPINFGPTTQELDWGKQWIEQAAISQDMQAKIDVEIKRIIDRGYKEAVAILTKNRAKLDLIAEELLKKETIEGDDFARLMKG